MNQESQEGEMRKGWEGTLRVLTDITAERAGRELGESWESVEKM